MGFSNGITQPHINPESPFDHEEFNSEEIDDAADALRAHEEALKRKQSEQPKEQ